MRRCALLLLLTACSAHMVVRPGDPASPYAPVNEASRGGVIRYSNEGIQAVRDKRRADAYRQMAKACGGRYRIDSEGPHTEGGVVVPAAYGSAVWQTSQSWYIQFSCVRDTTSVPEP